jgi:hypothetical protein
MRWLCRSCANTYGRAFHIREANAQSCWKCSAPRGMLRVSGNTDPHTVEIGVIYQMICTRNRCHTVNAIDNELCGHGPTGCGRDFPIKTDPETTELPEDVVLVVDYNRPYKEWFCIRCGGKHPSQMLVCTTAGCSGTATVGGAPIWSEEEE